MARYWICLIAIVLLVFAVWWWFMGPLIASGIAGVLLVGFALIEGLVALNERGN